MDLYDVIITPRAWKQLDDYIAYVQFTLLNEQAAKAIWLDAIETADKLKEVAGSLKFCTNSSLSELGYRPILFRHHNYVMLYRVEAQTAYVEAIYHTLQDYENTFA